MDRKRVERQLHPDLLPSGELHLLPGVFFVEGAKNGTLCDTNSGAVYSVNEVGCQVLSGEKQSEEFWMALQRAGLASEMAFQLEQK